MNKKLIALIALVFILRILAISARVSNCWVQGAILGDWQKILVLHATLNEREASNIFSCSLIGW